jgi:AN1-type zinc finger and ubiquitin domain-containing protein 1
MPKQICAHEDCKKKLNLTDFPCKCEKVFCTQHRYASEHNCSFDYRASSTTELLKTMSTPVVAQKIEVI